MSDWALPRKQGGLRVAESVDRPPPGSPPKKKAAPKAPPTSAPPPAASSPSGGGGAVTAAPPKRLRKAKKKDPHHYKKHMEGYLGKRVKVVVPPRHKKANKAEATLAGRSGIVVAIKKSWRQRQVCM